MAKGKLHELIAVEKDLKQVSNKVVIECSKTLKARSAHFLEQSKKYEPKDQEDQDIPDQEFIPMVTTVRDKLDYVEEHLVKQLDAVLQKESTNTQAKADLVITDSKGQEKTLLADVPVTVLVQYEGILENMRNNIYNVIPTLDPGREWTQDETNDKVWKANTVERVRTKKVPSVLKLAEATEHHKEQVQVVQVDQTVGTWKNDVRSGAFSPKQKSEILSRVEELLAGVKKARARANDIQVVEANIGREMFNYINGK